MIHAEAIPGDLQAVRDAALAGRQDVDGQAIGRDVLRRRDQVERDHRRHPCHDRAGDRRERQHGQHQRAGELHRQDPRPPAADVRPPSPIDDGRPHELERPWHGEQRHEPDRAERVPLGPQDHRHRLREEAERKALREVQRAEQREPRERGRGHAHRPHRPHRRLRAITSGRSGRNSPSAIRSTHVAAVPDGTTSRAVAVTTRSPCRADAQAT